MLPSHARALAAARQGLKKDEEDFKKRSAEVAEQDARLFENQAECISVVNDLKRLEMDQRQELERKLKAAEEKQGDLEKELDAMEKQVADLLAVHQSGGAATQRQDLERAAM